MDRIKAIKVIKDNWPEGRHQLSKALQTLIPEFQESEDDVMRKMAIKAVYSPEAQSCIKSWGVEPKDVIAWLEKKGDTNETINSDEFAQGVLKGAAINLICWIDYNAAEGNMCLSNTECKDIEDALVSGDWDKIYTYIKKKLEKQGEQKPTWSEEDEEAFHCLEYTVKRYYDDKDTITKYCSWLKSLKERYTWKPSDEQTNALYNVVSENLMDVCRTKDDVLLEQLLNDLMKLKGK